ncbi:baseplate J/gp47 family protein [Paenibacillus sp. N1-5-1-14]|uniref:baseplate J/gp47 family protein n=1 Tax=Paenibacillus radicibacter TaxID=2972488 RepID=UPI002158DE29|nr:baseplate J/gp47 family protein [Paenibacillus radicibacter]MCR8645572.1 baseplate J/gp47 family protein [Paenibacillus radicibacter]
MYENQTYAVILNRMLDRVPNDVDKREGSIIYDALAPAAAELSQMYAAMDTNIHLSFADTASGEYLDRRVNDYGISRKAATKAKRKGLFYGNNGVPIDVPLGSRFSIEKSNFVVVDRQALGQFTLECEVAGAIGNSVFGSMLPIDYMDGLVKVELTDILKPGDNEETDTALRERYYLRVRSPSTSGNIADYINWALEVPGVGGVRVIPLWDGGGTVKVVIVDNEKKPASGELVQKVQTNIAPSDSKGEGKAPIGALVNVVSAAGVGIDVTAAVTLSGSLTLEDVTARFRATLDDYLKGIAFTSDATVKYVRVGAMLLDIDGVQDYSDLRINNSTNNISVTQEQVALAGTVTLR